MEAFTILYLVHPQNRRVVYCYELYRGEWDGKTFWWEDSICLDDNIMCKYGSDELIVEVNPNYDPFCETELDKNQWGLLVLWGPCMTAYYDRGVSLWKILCRHKPVRNQKCYSIFWSSIFLLYKQLK